jgi:hypothetical protein
LSSASKKSNLFTKLPSTVNVSNLDNTSLP